MSGNPKAVRAGDAGRGPSIIMTSFDLAPLGYRLEEWLIEGDAQGYEPAGDLGDDGHWDVKPGATAAYRTRIVVVRPEDRERFDGTAVVEWFNVSGGADAGPDWTFIHNELIRRGSAYIGVSAQAVGVHGGRTIAGGRGGGLVAADPDRYGTLTHPGDTFSFDMFGDVGRLVRSGDVLDGLSPRTVIAIGESQSAFHLVTYVNALAPVDQVFDAFLIHGRGGGAAALSRPPQLELTMPPRVRIRTDLQQPVIVVQSETDVMVLGSVRSRQPDADRLRIWEIAGAAHADTYTLAGMADTGSLAPHERAAALAPTAMPMPGMESSSPINSGPQQHYVLQAAIDHLIRWAGGGAPAPSAPQLEVEQDGDAPRLVTDRHGNVRGGVRTPWVDVPTAVLSGLGQSGQGFARLFGRTEPFDDATLKELYPSRDAYLDAFTAATDATIDAGFLLPGDRDEILALAAASWDLAAERRATG